MRETEAALKEVEDSPISIIFVGIGSGDFGDLSTLSRTTEREFTCFVAYEALKEHAEDLTAAALVHIPSQLVSYFQSKNVFPNPEQPPADIAVTPYEPANDIEVPMTIDASGEPTVTGAAQTPPEPSKADKMKRDAIKFGSKI